MHSLIRKVLIAITAISISSCNLISNIDCGSKNEPYELVMAPFSFITTSTPEPGRIQTYVENDQRVFRIHLFAEDLCTAEHTPVKYQVDLTGIHSLPLDIVGRTSWNFLYEEESVMSENAIPPHTPVVAQQEVGLYQAFGEDPAWIICDLSLSFPTSGSWSQDSTYFTGHVSQMLIQVNGYHPK